MKITTKKSSLRIILPIAGILIVALLIVAYYFSTRTFQKNTSSKDTQTSAQRQASIDQQKDSFAQKESGTQSQGDSTGGSSSAVNGGSSASQTKKATVVVTYASQDEDGTVEVNSYIPDYYKDGTCTLTFTKGSKKLTRSTPAYRDATTTICTNPLIKGSDFPETGTWSLVVSYAADGGAGASDPQDVTIR